MVAIKTLEDHIRPYKKFEDFLNYHRNKTKISIDYKNSIKKAEELYASLPPIRQKRYNIIAEWSELKKRLGSVSKLKKEIKDKEETISSLLHKMDDVPFYKKYKSAGWDASVGRDNYKGLSNKLKRCNDQLHDLNKKKQKAISFLQKLPRTMEINITQDVDRLENIINTKLDDLIFLINKLNQFEIDITKSARELGVKEQNKKKRELIDEEKSKELVIQQEKDHELALEQEKVQSQHSHELALEKERTKQVKIRKKIAKLDKKMAKIYSKGSKSNDSDLAEMRAMLDMLKDAVGKG